MAESFHATLQTALLDDRRWPTRRVLARGSSGLLQPEAAALGFGQPEPEGLQRDHAEQADYRTDPTRDGRILAFACWRGWGRFLHGSLPLEQR